MPAVMGASKVRISIDAEVKSKKKINTAIKLH